MPVTIWPRECRKTDDIFSFFGWRLFPPSLVPSFPPFLSLSLVPSFARRLFSLSLFSHRSSLALPRSCAILLLFLFRRTLTYYWKAIVFSRRRFSYGAAIFHDPILERGENTRRGRRSEGREWQTGITGGNTGAFNMQLPSAAAAAAAGR